MCLVVYEKAFFDLQIQFAAKVAELSGCPFTQVLLHYTNLYIRFGLGRDFDPAHAIWQAYLAGLVEARDPREWTYRFYLSRAEVAAGPPVVATFGCFSYAQLAEDRIRLHFQNMETEGHSSLSLACLKHRRADLTALFGHVKKRLPQGGQVVGASWLYNLDAYRRLFPPAYVETARALHDRFQSMPRWGQFLDRHGHLKAGMTRPFIERLERLKCLERLHECFPFQVLTVSAPVDVFYRFYGM